MRRPSLPKINAAKARTVVRVVAALGAAGLLAAGLVSASSTSSPAAITVYIVNQAPGSFSNAAITKDIPAWEQAANQDFAPVWQTPQVNIKLVSSASDVPAGGIKALLVKSGPVQGALAYHTVTDGVPEIVAYTGVADYYGYSNSVDFTHELFEMLADPYISALNQGWPSAYVTVLRSGGGEQQVPFPLDSYWIQEACDPVEAYSYHLGNTAISDFVTPNWWNDQVKGGFDYMGVLGGPYTIAAGGYMSYEVAGQWYQVLDFRHAGRDANGFLKGEKLGEARAG